MTKIKSRRTPPHLQARACSDQTTPAVPQSPPEGHCLQEDNHNKAPPPGSNDMVPEGLQPSHMNNRIHTPKDSANIEAFAMDGAQMAFGEDGGAEDQQTQPCSAKRCRRPSTADEDDRDMKRFLTEWAASLDQAPPEPLNPSITAVADKDGEGVSFQHVDPALPLTFPVLDGRDGQGFQGIQTCPAGNAFVNSPGQQDHPDLGVREDSSGFMTPGDAAHNPTSNTESTTSWHDSDHQQQVHGAMESLQPLWPPAAAVAVPHQQDGDSSRGSGLSDIIPVGRLVVDRRLAEVVTWWECQYDFGGEADVCGRRWGQPADLAAHYSTAHFPVVLVGEATVPACAEPLTPWSATCTACGAPSTADTCPSCASAASPITPCDTHRRRVSWGMQGGERIVYGHPVDETALLTAVMRAAARAGGPLTAALPSTGWIRVTDSDGFKADATPGCASVGGCADENSAVSDFEFNPYQLVASGATSGPQSPWTELVMGSAPVGDVAGAGQLGLLGGQSDGDYQQRSALESATTPSQHVSLQTWPCSAATDSSSQITPSTSAFTASSSGSPVFSRHENCQDGNVDLAANFDPAHGDFGYLSLGDSGGVAQASEEAVLSSRFNVGSLECTSDFVVPSPSMSPPCQTTVCPRDLQL